MPKETDEGVPNVDIVGRQEQARLIEFHSPELAIDARSWQKMMQLPESWRDWRTTSDSTAGGNSQNTYLLWWFPEDSQFEFLLITYC